ncbi:DUF3048 domain-containing protein [Lihuaxuella thermophila]|uniref:DUF3048 domain-containing protein n=1 Tax=Lihuaxuella thermophila TaxID=1173111 RepID=A0A1H8C853_9BACL|nr:DUF3048 domain-containing protein [Lihuaxuella thermophila]SEM91210.1 Protein of unknown function [Lihuaxuella thermophila]
MRKIGGWLVWGLLILSLAACSFLTDKSKTEPGQNQPGQEKAEKRAPLTGLATDAPDHPVLMVMVNNHRAARPQTGLGLADVVVEMLAEGEITRFAAFYHSRTEGTVGPVRSVRNYYLDLAEGSKSIVVHAGGETEALARIRREGLPSLDGIHADSRFFTRVPFRKPPHNLYTDLNQLYKAAEEKGYQPLPPRAAYLFSDRAAAEKGKNAGRIQLIYHPLYQAGYQYDDASKSYIRYTEGERQVDRESNQPLSMQNVLVVFAKHEIIDSVGHRSVDVKGAGKGYLFQRGKAIPVEWRYRDGWIVPFSGGKEVPLLPGRTWVNVLPQTGKVSFE